MGKTTRVVMPQLGESVHEGTISRWLVKPGDRVVEFEPMLEVDTDKVNAEVPAPVSGILREILAKEGETVQAGAEIAIVETGGDGKVTATPEAPAPAPKSETPKVEAEAPSPARGEGRGEGLKPATTASAPRGESPGEGLKPATTAEPAGPHRYSPGVQMAASDLKVDLSQVSGTGLGGRITKKDVQDFAARAKAQPAGQPTNTVPIASGEG